jgi:hypothetical protein
VAAEETRRGWWVAAGLVLVLGYAFSRADLPALADRLADQERGREPTDNLARHSAGREDFWITGTGAGTTTSPCYYQRADRFVQFNQAHNRTCRSPPRGIVLVGLVLAVDGTRPNIRQRLIRIDRGVLDSRRRSVDCWPWRAESLETGLVMPANAALRRLALCLPRAIDPRKEVF